MKFRSALIPEKRLLWEEVKGCDGMKGVSWSLVNVFAWEIFQ